MTKDELKIQLCKDSVSSHRIKATQISFDTKRPISSAHKNVHRIQQIWIPKRYSVWDTLQEFVYEGRRKQFFKLQRSSDCYQRQMAWCRHLTFRIRSHNSSGKASSSSSKGEWRTYLAHFLLISWLIRTTVTFCRSLRTSGYTNDESLAKIALRRVKLFCLYHG